MAAQAMATPCRLLLILLGIVAVAVAAPHPAHEVGTPISSLIVLVGFLFHYVIGFWVRARSSARPRQEEEAPAAVEGTARGS